MMCAFQPPQQCAATINEEMAGTSGCVEGGCVIMRRDGQHNILWRDATIWGEARTTENCINHDTNSYSIYSLVTAVAQFKLVKHDAMGAHNGPKTILVYEPLSV